MRSDNIVKHLMKVECDIALCHGTLCRTCKFNINSPKAVNKYKQELIIFLGSPRATANEMYRR